MSWAKRGTLWAPDEPRIWTPGQPVTAGRGPCEVAGSFPMMAAALPHPPQFDSENSGDDADRALSFSLTIANRGNRLVLIGMRSLDSVAVGTHTVTVGGQATTQIVSDGTSLSKVSLHAIVAPASGAQTVAADAGTDTTTSLVVCAISLYSCKQVLPSVTDSATATATSFSDSFTSTMPASWMVDVIGLGVETTEPTTGTTGQIRRSAHSRVSSPTATLAMSTRPHPSAEARALSWTWGGASRSYRWLACQVNAA